jgi:hypothetical protein
VTGLGLLLALAATIGPLPPAAGEPGASLVVRLPDAVRTIVVVLFALSALLLLGMQRPRRPTEDPDGAGRGPRRRPAWAAVLVPLPFLLMVGLLWYLSREPWTGENHHPLERAFTTIADLLDLLARARKAPTSVPALDFTLAALLLVLALATFALLVVVALTGPLEKWLARTAVPARADALPRGEAPADLRALPDARAAILGAYRRLEQAVAAAHAPRAPWQTPAEFMRTTLDRLPVPGPPLARLTGLFELARFSDRALGPEARDAACDSLDEITTALAAAETTPSPSRPPLRADAS